MNEDSVQWEQVLESYEPSELLTHFSYVESKQSLLAHDSIADVIKSRNSRAWVGIGMELAPEFVAGSGMWVCISVERLIESFFFCRQLKIYPQNLWES